MTKSGDEIQVVVLAIADQWFAFEVSQVERILRYQEPTPLPHAAEFLEGVVALGDDLVPLVDLRKRLSLDSTLGEESRIIVLEIDGQLVGVLVDSVREVHRLDVATITAPPKMVRGLAARYIAGLFTLGETTVVMLNAGKLFSSKERLQLTAAGASAREQGQQA